LNELLELLRKLEVSRFYGSVEVKFEAGAVTVIKKTESIKPSTSDHRNNRGLSHEPKEE
jgi:hypothetical protein